MAIFDSNSRQGIYNFQNILGILVGWFPVSSLKAKGLKQMVQKQIEKCFEVVTKTRLQRSQSSSFICWWVLAQFSSHMIHALVLFFFFPEIESIENRQTHSCQFVQACGFSWGLQACTGLPDNDDKLFQFLHAHMLLYWVLVIKSKHEKISGGWNCLDKVYIEEKSVI